MPPPDATGGTPTRVGCSAMSGERSLTSPAIAGMLTCEPLIAAPVVACDSCHELLGPVFISTLDFGQKINSIVTTEGGRDSSMMQDLHLPALPGTAGETQVTRAGSEVLHAGVHGRCSVRHTRTLEAHVSLRGAG
jgi:hypothetical protein